MRAHAGFTLMEMLVAMTLLSLVLLTLFGGLRFVGGGEAKIEAVMEDAEGMDVVRFLLTRQLANSFPVTVGLVPPRPLFTATPERLAFPILRPPGQGSAGMVLAVFDIIAEGGRKRLVYREYPFKPGPLVLAAERPTRSTLLTEGDASMGFRYRGASGEWRNDWSGEWSPPRLVAYDNPPWPTLIAATRAEALPR